MEKVNPYNQNNKLVTENDIINIMETLNINDFKINNILLYQRSFVHTSYCSALYKDKEGQPLFNNIDNSLDLQEISYETMEFLGDSIEEIAYEKAGIAKSNKPMIYGDTVAVSIIEKQANLVDAKLVARDREFSIQKEANQFSWAGVEFTCI